MTREEALAAGWTLTPTWLQVHRLYREAYERVRQRHRMAERQAFLRRVSVEHDRLLKRERIWVES